MLQPDAQAFVIGGCQKQKRIRERPSLVCRSPKRKELHNGFLRICHARNSDAAYAASPRDRLIAIWAFSIIDAIPAARQSGMHCGKFKRRPLSAAPRKVNGLKSHCVLPRASTLA